VSEARYRTLFEQAPIGIVYADARSYYIDANESICRMLGYSRDELIGLHASDILVESEARHVARALTEIGGSANHRREWQFRRKDGSIFEAEVIATKFADGTLLGMIQDIGPLKEHEREIARMSRLYAALSQINQAIVRTSTRQQLFASICQVLVDHGGLRMAWIGWHDPETQQLVPQAQAGDQSGYLVSIQVFGADRPEGRGSTGTAFRSQRPSICNDIVNDPSSQTWRQESERRGFLSSAAFPIRLQGVVRGTLSVYADKREFFHEKEIALLEEAALNISFALDNFARDETRRLAEQTVRNEKLFSETMIESMPGLLYLYDEDGRFLRWNRRFENVSGYSAQEIARMHPHDFFRLEDGPRLEAKVAEVLGQGESSIEALLLAKNGTTAPYFFTGRSLTFEGKTCLVGVGIDISDRVLAQEGLAESERKYRELVEYANSIILRWNSEGHVTFLNRFGLEFFGYTEEQIIGRHVLETIVPPRESGGRNLEQLMVEICAAPETFEQNVNENIRRDGERVWVAWTNRIVRNAAGEVVEILSIGTDVTASRLAEEEREKRHRAEAADHVKSAFLATMSHELRTPLNSIIGFTGIILQGLAGPLNAEQSKQLNMVRVSARHLLALVNDVLDISKIEAGQLDVARQPFDLRQSITRVMASVTPQAEAKQLALHAQVAPTLGQAVGDERRFEQVLLNLLSNAVKFSDHGEVTLTAGPVADFGPPGAQSGQPAVRVDVSDTGIGIKPEHLPQLFQPFNQVDSGLSRQHEGTGLGLAICRRLVELMGGEIGVTSEWGRGSTFSITLPVKDGRDHESPDSAH
jgi:PAS domain S-box-containing protein